MRRAPSHTAAPRLSGLAVQGFTLVEMLVALAVMAVLSLMSWSAIDGMTRTQASTQARADELLGLQNALAQWSADLDAVEPTGVVTALDFNGQVLRMTRRDAADSVNQSVGLRVVAWARQRDSGQWVRWQSPPLQQRDALNEAWARALRWGQSPVAGDADSQVQLLPAERWELFYFRGNAWSNPLSAAGAGQVEADGFASVPDGVRLVLYLPGTSATPGRIVRDWVNPMLSGSGQ